MVPNIVQQRHSADSAQILGPVLFVQVHLTPCLMQGDLQRRKTSARCVEAMVIILGFARHTVMVM